MHLPNSHIWPLLIFCDNHEFHPGNFPKDLIIHLMEKKLSFNYYKDNLCIITIQPPSIS
jgi:hypothetical protein